MMVLLKNESSLIGEDTCCRKKFKLFALSGDRGAKTLGMSSCTFANEPSGETLTTSYFHSFGTQMHTKNPIKMKKVGP